MSSNFHNSHQPFAKPLHPPYHAEQQENRDPNTDHFTFTLRKNQQPPPLRMVKMFNVGADATSDDVRRDFQVMREQAPPVQGFFNQKLMQRQADNNSNFLNKVSGAIPSTPDWSLNLPQNTFYESTANESQKVDYSSFFQPKMSLLMNETTDFAEFHSVNHQDEIMLGQTPPHLYHATSQNEELLHCPPKTIFNMTGAIEFEQSVRMEEAPEVEPFRIYEDVEENQHLLKTIGQQQTVNYQVDSGELFSSGPLNLMTVAEFSQSRKSPSNTHSPFQTRYYFDPSMQNHPNYLGSAAQRKCALVSSQQPGPHETKTKLGSLSTIAQRQEAASLSNLIGKRILTYCFWGLSHTEPSVLSAKRHIYTTQEVDMYCEEGGVQSRIQTAQIGQVTLKAKVRQLEYPPTQMSMLFSVYRDEDIGLDDQLLQETLLDPHHPDIDLDCLSSSSETAADLVDTEKERCLGDLAWAMQECEQIGEQCVRDVLLRNTDIHDRVSQPDLFDRFGKLKSSTDLANPKMPYDQECAPQLDYLMERMSLCHDDEYRQPGCL